MLNFHKYAAVAALTLAAAPALAADLLPVHSQSIDLGGIAGDAYYTVEPEGYRVIATFAQRGEPGAAMRFQAVLAPGQSVIVSTPRATGEPANAVEIIRQQNRVVVHKPAS
jgi:hypothetical protein